MSKHNVLTDKLCHDRAKGLEPEVDIRLEKTDQVSFSLSVCCVCLTRAKRSNVGIEESMLNYSHHSSNSLHAEQN